MNDSAQRALPEDTPLSKDNDDIAVTAASSDSMTLRTKVKGGMDLPKILHDAYHKDAMYSKIMVDLDVHKKFGIRDGLIWTKNQLRRNIVCPWDIFHGGRRMIEIIIDHAHQTVGHYSQLQPTEDFELHSKGLLVAEHGHRHRIILHLVCKVPNE
jgi:hypothetical protein